MHPIIERPIKWNEARYDREFNHELTCDLLFEEIQEYNEATTEVDKLDALIDIYFVSIGALWKLGVDPNKTLKEISIQLPTLDLEVFLTAFMESIEHQKHIANLCMLVEASCNLMLEMGLSEKQCIDAILIVCDSNDSKTINKTPSYVKANIDKGDSFIPPEPRLQEILDRRVKDES